MKEVYVVPEIDFIMIESADILMSSNDTPFEEN
jgi:hypothetical protein